jgi:hypothetical protein
MPRRAGWTGTTGILRVLTAAGLAVDAYVHADLAGRYDLNRGNAVISQGDLFRLEAAVSAVAAVAVLVTARAVVAVLALLVAGSALGGLVLYLGYDGALGPLPNMYEPVLYPEKVTAAVAEGVAALAAALWLTGRAARLRRS